MTLLWAAEHASTGRRKSSIMRKSKEVSSTHACHCNNSTASKQAYFLLFHIEQVVLRSESFWQHEQAYCKTVCHEHRTLVWPPTNCIWSTNAFNNEEDDNKDGDAPVANSKLQDTCFPCYCFQCCSYQAYSHGSHIKIIDDDVSTTGHTLRPGAAIALATA